MDPILISLLGSALFGVASKLAEKGVVDPALESGLEPFKKWLTAGYQKKKAEKALQEAFEAALKWIDVPVDDENKLASDLEELGLMRLQAEKATLLRQQVAQAVLACAEPEATPPEDLLISLRWPRSRKGELARLLAGLRAELAGTEEWRPLVAYADAAAERGLLKGILEKLSQLDALVVTSESGKALRVVVEQAGLSREQAADIEHRYREDLIRELYWHSFRGIVQIKQDVRFPLTEIYLELGLLELHSKEEQERLKEKLLEGGHEERAQLEERRLEQRVSDGLAKSQRLVILGDPGTGKTISLRYIALLLAYGYGAARLGLEEPFIPLFVRLADYARELEKRPALALDNYLLEYIQQAHSSSARLGEFLRFALEQGKCMILLDGLDEVSTDLKAGRASHGNIVKAVQKFCDLWCDGSRANRMVITSRIEGYWIDPLRSIDHVQLSPLRPPDEIETFLLQWYTAHERAHDNQLTPAEAEARARKRVDDLLPRVLSTPSVRRLATNPLLLTILALINENVGRLPNRRIKLYEIASQTLIESWRQMQVGLPDELLAELGEDKIIRIMSPLAYWLHENRPGGTASYDEWQSRLCEILTREGYEGEADDLATRFLHHARFQTGLLAERSLGQYGFFHLTFEEYLAAREIARQRAEERREMLKRHWADPRWQEVILLAVGQLGIAESRTDDASDFLEELLKMEPESDEQAGRPALLAGRALADMGLRSVTPFTKRAVLDALKIAAQDVDPDTEKPNLKPYVPVLVRADAADTVDELGYVPDDLYIFVRTQGYKAWIARYPITNMQYQRFLESGCFNDADLWMNLPKFDEQSDFMKDTTWKEEGLRWRQQQLEQRERIIKDNVIYPLYWEDVRFGASRKCAPVVGITWYEANAYCKWLSLYWPELEEGRSNAEIKTAFVRLPTEAEWVAAAGGLDPQNRFPWDEKGKATPEPASEEDPAMLDILQRANVSESGIRRTTPVWMYPLGQSTQKVFDLAGNVWEWQANYRDKDHDVLALRGGSWYFLSRFARLSERSGDLPYYRYPNIGFRVVALPR